MKHDYAREKLMLLLRDLDRYNGDEFWREMSRISHGATDHPSAENLLRKRDEYRNHLAAIAEMTGNSDDIGAAHEGVNAVIEELGRHKRMFAAACETLGAIQKTLGNDIVGCEPCLVKELVKERDALARFADDMVTEIFEHPGSDIDGKLAEDCLLEAGIIFAAPYEPNGKHVQAPVEDVEEGEDLLERCQWFLKAVAAAKAQQ